MNYKFKLITAFVLLCSLSLYGCSLNNSDPISRSGFYFNTVITVTLYDSSKESLLDDCFELADKYEKYFSNTIESSDISLINAADGKPVAVHDETIELLETGIYYGNLSSGNFDITIGELSDLWDISTKALIDDADASMIPSDDDINAALDTVDYGNIVINGNEVSLKNPDSKIDLGGIAKGYIADKMKEYLVSEGVSSGIINLGGNVLTIGEKADGSDYKIGIQEPFSEDGSSIAALEIKDASVVSSGVYERYFEVDDVIYHHILDTSTGYPYQNGLLGVTIISEKSVDGDVLSTTCFSLGLDDGMVLIETIPDTEAVFITDDYELFCTSGVEDNIKLLK